MLYSWSIEKPRSFPLDFGLSFYVLALLSLTCVLMAWALPDSVNMTKGSLYNEVDAKMEKRKKEKGYGREGREGTFVRKCLIGVCCDDEQTWKEKRFGNSLVMRGM